MILLISDTIFPGEFLIADVTKCYLQIISSIILRYCCIKFFVVSNIHLLCVVKFSRSDQLLILLGVGHWCIGRPMQGRGVGQQRGGGGHGGQPDLVLLTEHVLPDMVVVFGYSKWGEHVHLDLGLILQGVAHLVLPLLGLFQQQIQLVIVHILPETHDLLLRGVGPLLSPRQLVPQLVDLGLQLGHGRIILGLLGRLQFGLDSVLLVLALGLKLDLEVGPLLFLLGKLLLELLPGLLLASPGADQAVNPRLQLGLLNQEAGDLRLKSSLA